MENTASLISELLAKLDELEQKVVEHRQKMALEFQQHSGNLLQNANASEDVTARVEFAIRDSMHNYPALSPALDQAKPITNESPSSAHESTADRRRRGRISPPPKLPHTSGTPPDNGPRSPNAHDQGPRSPHAREREFHGLFTPSYLPLLENRDATSAPLLQPVLPISQSQLCGEETLLQENPPTSPSTLPSVVGSRPGPVRRTTEETLSSVGSDDSASKARRSALRRSSTGSAKNQSPRRVRFEVAGEEVLPTASPLLSPRVPEQFTSPLPSSDNLIKDSYGSLVVESIDQESSLLGSSPPRPKKITSTDRLKALARSSNEDTSNWTVVGELQDIDEDEDDGLLTMASPNGRPSTRRAPAAPKEPVLQQEDQTPTVLHVEHQEDVDDEDDDLLEMPTLTSFKGKKNFSPPEPSPPSDAGSKASDSTTNTIKAPTQVANDPLVIPARDIDDEEDLFGYEPDQGTNDTRSMSRHNFKPVAKYIEVEEDEPVNEHVDTSTEEAPAATQYSTSPAIPIAKPISVESPAPTTPSRHVPGSVGSYKGRPFTLPSVRDPELLRRAAEMGDFYSFVGSVDGRSGVDATSYQPEVTYFSGTPRSLSERLMMEDLQQANRSDTSGHDTA